MSATDGLSAPKSNAGIAEPVLRRRSRRTNHPLAHLNKNGSDGRRVADLTRAYLKALGNPTDVERQAACVQAAELAVIAENARTSALKTGALPDLDACVRVQGAADRALARLGLGQAPASKPAKVPDLQEYLSGRSDEAAE
jgi:hypothetical protein